MNLGFLGLAVGFISAGLGVGGGAIMVPTLVSFFHFDFRKAASTSLATIIPISLVGAAGHILISRHSLNVSLCLSFIPFCIAGSILAGRAIGHYKTSVLKAAFAIFILIAGLKMTGLYDFSFLVFDALKEISLGREELFAAAFGVITGAISTVLGVGCGLIIVPFFVIVKGLGMHEAITLSLSTMFFLAVTATLVHRKHKAFDQKSVGRIMLPALAGAVIGAFVSNHLPAHTLKAIFGAFLLCMSFNFLAGERLITSIRSRRKAGHETQHA